MVFLIITLAALMVGVFCTFKIANRFGLNLNVRSLLLCSLCALVINFFLPYIILQFSNYQLLLLFALIVTSAFFITQYNERLNMRAVTDNVQEFAVETPECFCACAAQQTDAAPAEPAVATAPAPEARPEAAMPLPDAVQPAAPPPFAPTAGRATTLPPCFTRRSRDTRKPKRKKCAFSVVSVRPATVEEAPQLASTRLPACLCSTVAERVARDMQNAKLLKLTAVLAKLGSLDALLDYAYAQKELGAYENAIFAFKQALERYQSDAYAPFMVIELCNIYKKAGAYDEAIVIYKRAFQLPAVRGDEALKREFEQSLAYLRIVRETLLKYNCLKTPFGRIPGAFLEEIESAFHNWRQKHAS